MKKIIINLRNGKELETMQDYLWGLNESLNDIRTDFIEIGKYCISKDEIVSIEQIELGDDNNVTQGDISEN